MAGASYRERQLDRQAVTRKLPDTTPENASAVTPASSFPAPTSGSSPQADAGVAKSGQAAGATSTNTDSVGSRATPPDVSKNDNSSISQSPQEKAAATTASQSVTGSEPGAPFELTVRPKDRAWVSIKSDGKFVVRGIIKPPDVKTIRATSQVVFWTGNAGAVEVSFNGKNVPLTGGENDERVLVFNSRGLLPHAASQ